MRNGVLSWAFFLCLSLFSRPTGATECQVALLPGAFERSSLVARWILSEDEYFREYRDFFKGKGCLVKQMHFPPDSTIEQRAFLIRNQLEESGPWWVIAHSQAGLDLRFAFQTLRLNPSRVRGVVSIGTPHHGSRVATWALDHLQRRSLFWRVLKLAGYDLGELRFLPEMDGDFLIQKAGYFIQEPRVAWFSVGSDCQNSCHWALRLLAHWAGARNGDGLVELESQRFGQWLGPFDLDHLSEVGVDGAKRGIRGEVLKMILKIIQKASKDERLGSSS